MFSMVFCEFDKKMRNHWTSVKKTKSKLFFNMSIAYK